MFSVKRTEDVFVFGSPEEEGEEQNDKVCISVHWSRTKNPCTLCRYLKKNTDPIRPVKVTVSSSAIVDQIMANTKKLRQVEKFRTVFLCPDRFSEQRQIQRDLVTDIKGRVHSEYEMRFYIRGEQIHSAPRTDET